MLRRFQHVMVAAVVLLPADQQARAVALPLQHASLSSAHYQAIKISKTCQPVAGCDLNELALLQAGSDGGSLGFGLVQALQQLLIVQQAALLQSAER